MYKKRRPKCFSEGQRGGVDIFNKFLNEDFIGGLRKRMVTSLEGYTVATKLG